MKTPTPIMFARLSKGLNFTSARYPDEVWEKTGNTSARRCDATKPKMYANFHPHEDVTWYQNEKVK